jgi:hypothetical protein
MERFHKYATSGTYVVRTLRFEIESASDSLGLFSKSKLSQADQVAEGTRDQ